MQHILQPRTLTGTGKTKANCSCGASSKAGTREAAIKWQGTHTKKSESSKK